MASHSDRTGVCRKHDTIYPARFRARWRRRFRRQRISTSSHRRYAFPHHMDDGAGRRRSSGSGFRSRDGVNRSGADDRVDAGFFGVALARQADSGTLVTNMLPGDLNAEQFKGYPPEARKLITDYVGALQRLPLSFVPSLLREVIDYDFRFPPERKAIERELANLKSLNGDQQREWFQDLSRITISPKLESSDWVNTPALFIEQLSAHLWATHQLDAFRQAAIDYANRLQAVIPPEPPVMSRLAIAVIGQGATAHDEPLFRKLRPHGGYFSRVNPENGLDTLLNTIAARAKAHPAP